MTKLPEDEHRRCGWCGTSLPTSRVGRPRIFCGAAHRQRAYEARRQADDHGLDADAVIISQRQLASVQDRLWALRDAIEIAGQVAAEKSTAGELASAIRQISDAAGDLDQLWLAPRDQ